MVVIECPATGCSYRTADVGEALVLKLLEIHAVEHTSQKVVKSSPPKLTRPSIDIGADEERWMAFIRRWDTFKRGSSISEADTSAHLFECASAELSELLLRLDQEITLRTETEVLEKMHSMAVIPIARGVTRAELLKMHQLDDENFRAFAARVKGKAETCGFAANAEYTCEKCNHKGTVSADYTQSSMRDVLLTGIADVDIRREALSCEELQNKSINEMISFVERREMSREQCKSSSLSAISTFKRIKSQNHGASKAGTSVKHQQCGEAQPTSCNQQKRPCLKCGKTFRPFKRGRNGINKKPYVVCFDCWRDERRRKECAMLQDTEIINNVTSLDTSEVRSFILSHDVFVNGQCAEISGNSHPSVMLSVRHVNNGRIVSVPCIADSGAQSNLWGFVDFKRRGFCAQDLSPVTISISAVNNHSLKIIGAFHAEFEGKSPSGVRVTCRDIVYVSDSVSHFYLSYNTMKNLAIVDEQFPTVGDCLKLSEHCSGSESVFIRGISSGCSQLSTASEPCKCPQRTVVPSRPKNLPFTPIVENNEKMRKWLLETFASSTFNTCPHRPLMQMKGPPLEIHVDDDAKPRVCRTAAPVPIHWQQRFYDDLIRDKALDVIERVPYGEPETWCHRCVLTRKHDGSPRRTVDLSPLNRYCRRETHAVESPFHLARRVPPNTWKSVTDAWNGYHQVPLRESDRHLTTFITQFGRWRYKRAPQGYLSSGDGYNRRFQAILSEFPRKERCVDDTLHYDEDLETHWWRTIDLLILLGSSGVVLNPGKFQFASKTVEFAGFKISTDGIEPLPRYIDAIKSFPTPASKTDIRSWYGLLNQVSNYGQLRDCLAPFRQFLSAKTKFEWSEELNKAFEDSKISIIRAIQKGVQIFDMNKRTCLRPDWSSKGIGYFLLQKHCTCPGNMPDCCVNGWRVTLAGSRFLQKAETRYAAIEGEALAIAWGLEQTKYFTQGCKDLLVVTDHKPLVKIFSDRTLDEISNTRLFRMKQRTLPWYFEVAYLPGKTNSAADAASRHPCIGYKEELNSCSDADVCEVLIIASIIREAEELTALTWAKIAEETARDPVLIQLSRAISENFQGEYSILEEFSPYKDRVYIERGVVMMSDRVVIPLSLRRGVLKTLHAAHQGVSAMGSRARALMFWPGMTKDIEDIRSSCYECNRNAPSQASLPSIQAIPPTTPFQQIYSDFFDFGGYHFLIIGDRLSGWTDVYPAPVGGVYSGARGLVKCLRTFFATYGVPEEISSDGGPEFKSSACGEFLRRWGVRHRISSAYFPQSNGRAEVAVKSTKRLLRTNVQNGSIDNDKFLRALLQLRNTPESGSNMSPAQILFGRPLRDTLLFADQLKKFSHLSIRKTWREAWKLKEMALRARFAETTEHLNYRAKKLPQLEVGNKCFVQNQNGRNPLKWERSGTVVEVLPHNQYMIKIDGSGRVTRRNRKFLRRFKPASVELPVPCRDRWVPECGVTESPQHTEIPRLAPGAPVTGSNDNLPPITTPPPPPRVPRALQRLMPYNKPGLKESLVFPDTRLRPRNDQS